MNGLFIDTSAWLAIINSRDKRHKPAVEIYPQLLREYDVVITTNHILAESYELIRRRLGHTKATDFLSQLFQSPRLRIIYATRELEIEAIKLLEIYNDQDFSYIDAVSFALMQELNIKAAFAFDGHFVIVGFTTLPAV